MELDVAGLRQRLKRPLPESAVYGDDGTWRDAGATTRGTRADFRARASATTPCHTATETSGAPPLEWWSISAGRWPTRIGLMGVLAIIAALLLEQWRPLGERKGWQGALSACIGWLEQTFNGRDERHGL